MHIIRDKSRQYDMQPLLASGDPTLLVVDHSLMNITFAMMRRTRFFIFAYSLPQILSTHLAYLNPS